MTIINASGGCSAPVTVQARARRLGLYELAVYQLDGEWCWMVLLEDEPKAEGTARSEERAFRAAEAAVRRRTLRRSAD